MHEWINALYFTLFKNIYEYVTFFSCKNSEPKSSTPKSNVSLERYIPLSTPVVRSLLGKGEIYKEWNKMIEETAYHVLSLSTFETKGITSA